MVHVLYYLHYYYLRYLFQVIDKNSQKSKNLNSQKSKI